MAPHRLRRPSTTRTPQIPARGSAGLLQQPPSTTWQSFGAPPDLGLDVAAVGDEVVVGGETGLWCSGASSPTWQPCHPVGLTGHRVSAILEREDGVWAGTLDAGLWWGNSVAEPFVQSADLPPEAAIYELASDGSRLVAATFGRGLIEMRSADLFADGFEDGGSGAWSVVVP